MRAHKYKNWDCQHTCIQFKCAYISFTNTHTHPLHLSNAPDRPVKTLWNIQYVSLWFEFYLSQLFSVALCVCLHERGRDSVCLHVGIWRLFLLMDILGISVCVCLCMFARSASVGWIVQLCLYTFAVALFLLSWLPVIGSEPTKPFVWVLLCAYINCVMLVNNIAK